VGRFLVEALEMLGRGVEARICWNKTANGNRIRRERTIPDTLQLRILLAPSLEFRNPHTLLKLFSMQLLKLIKDAPDIVTGGEGVLGIHRQVWWKDGSEGRS
jgi:hypothetical protein